MQHCFHSLLTCLSQDLNQILTYLWYQNKHILLHATVDERVSSLLRMKELEDWGLHLKPEFLLKVD